MKYKGKKRYDFGGFASADIAGAVPTNMGGGFSTPSDAPIDPEMLKKLAGPMSSMVGSFGKNNNSNKKQPITYNTGNPMSDYYLNMMEAEKQRNTEIGGKVGGGLGTLAGLGAGIGLAIATGGATTTMIPAFATAGNKIGKFGGSKVGEVASDFSFASGGHLSTIPKSAGTHEQSPYGGVQLGNSNNYVEGGEAIHNGYVFSNRLKPMAMGGTINNSDNKKSYADIAKKILKDKLGRSEDRFSKKTADLYSSRLQAMQEEQREAMGLADSNYGAYGGNIKFADGGGIYDVPTAEQKQYNDIVNNNAINMMMWESAKGAPGTSVNYPTAKHSNYGQNNPKAPEFNSPEEAYAWAVKNNSFKGADKLELTDPNLKSMAMSWGYNHSQDPRLGLLNAAGIIDAEERQRIYNNNVNPDIAAIDALWTPENIALINSKVTPSIYDAKRRELWNNTTPKVGDKYIARANWKKRANDEEFDRMVGNYFNNSMSNSLQTVNNNSQPVTNNYIDQLPEEDPGVPTIATKGTPKVTEDGLDYTGIDMPGGISGGVFGRKKPTPTMAKGVDDTDYKEYAKYLEDNMNNMNTSNKALWAKALPGALMQSAGPVSAIAYGMQGPDDVSFERIKPNLINPKRVENLSRSALLRLMAGSKAGVRGNAKTAGDLIAGYSAADNIYADQIGSMIGTPRMQADQLNMAAKNQIGAQNANIAMQESIARQQEKDAARSAITTGLSGVGAAGATGLKDARAEYSQANLNSQMLSLLPDLYSHFNFEKGDDGVIKMTPKAFGGKLKTKRK
jgi:hypothetical protein